MVIWEGIMICPECSGTDLRRAGLKKGAQRPMPDVWPVLHGQGAQVQR